MFIVLEAKCNLGTNEVTERLQSVSLLLGEDEKANRISHIRQLERNYPRPHAHVPLPGSPPKPVVTSSAPERKVSQHLVGGERKLNTRWPGAGKAAKERKWGWGVWRE